MTMDFSKLRITLLLAPVDMRAGFYRLAVLAQALLHIDVTEGNDAVVFLSKRRQVAKLIWADAAGVSVLTRRLTSGTFEALLARVGGDDGHAFTAEELFKFLDGERLYVRRQSVFG